MSEWRNWTWPLGTRVRKVRGASWRGSVVGYYQTALTQEGYAVESEREEGSVQIYPKAALEVVLGELVDYKDAAGSEAERVNELQAEVERLREVLEKIHERGHDSILNVGRVLSKMAKDGLKGKI